MGRPEGDTGRGGGGIGRPVDESGGRGGGGGVTRAAGAAGASGRAALGGVVGAMRAAGADGVGASGGRAAITRGTTRAPGGRSSSTGRLRTTRAGSTSAATSSGSASTGSSITGVSTTTTGVSSTTGTTSSTTAAAAAAAFLVGFLTLAGSSGWCSRTSPSRSAPRRTRSACASSMLEEWLFTPMPSARQRSRASLLVSPSSFASSCSRIFPATLGVQPFVITGDYWVVSNCAPASIDTCDAVVSHVGCLGHENYRAHTLRVVAAHGRPQRMRQGVLGDRAIEAGTVGGAHPCASPGSLTARREQPTGIDRETKKHIGGKPLTAPDAHAYRPGARAVSSGHPAPVPGCLVSVSPEFGPPEFGSPVPVPLVALPSTRRDPRPTRRRSSRRHLRRSAIRARPYRDW